MKRRILAGSNSQGWRFIVYGSILIYLLLFYSNEDGFWGSSATAHYPNPLRSAVEERNAESEPTGSALQIRTLHVRGPSEIDSGFQPIGSTVSNEIMSIDSIKFEDESLVEDEVNNLIRDRAAIYEESRTLTVSEIAKLHSVKSSENFPFGVTNEAQLILRELAIEHRIPQECSEEMSEECLVILERSQAGLMPLECQNPTGDGECKKAFSRFWE